MTDTLPFDVLAAFHETLDDLPQGLCVFDADRRMQACNSNLIVFLELPADPLRKVATYDRFIAHCLRKGMKTDRLGWHVAESGMATQVAIPDGRVLEVKRFRMGDGGLMISFGNSEAARLRATIALQTANETLERHVAERTAELTSLNLELQRSIAERVAAEAALVEAKTAAEQANLSKTRFLAAASHDLLQPLNAGRLFVSALMERQLTPADQALVHQTMSALDSVEELLEALLEISKLDSGASPLELRDFALNSLLASMKAEFGPLAREKGLTLDIPACPLWVRSDRSLLRRILQNFVSNAVKYTLSGSVTVRCAQAGDRVDIQVIDTGPGIPAESQEAIFEEFHRLDRRQGNTGMGLGLAIVKRASRALGHPVTVKSEPGQGATFAIQLPSAAAQACCEPTLQPLTQTPLEGLTVLVIDNDEQILRGMGAVLGGWDCHVILAADEAEARVALRHRKNPPDFVLVDYHLGPDVRGDQVLRNLACQLGPEPHALVVTADRSAETRAALDGQGLNLLSKPVRPAQLRAWMNHRLSQRPDR